MGLAPAPRPGVRLLGVPGAGEDGVRPGRGVERRHQRAHGGVERPSRLGERLPGDEALDHNADPTRIARALSMIMYNRLQWGL